MSNKKESRRKPLEERLENLVSKWSFDSKKIVPRGHPNKSGYILQMLTRLMEGWELVNETIEEYEGTIELFPELERKYPRDRVYDAGLRCCEDLNKRWDKLYEEAKSNSLLSPYEITQIDKFNKEEQGPQNQKV